MKLYEVLFPDSQICRETELYYRANDPQKVTWSENEKLLTLHNGGEVSFDTYFNSFPIEKYRRYTNACQFSIAVCFQGQGTFCIRSLEAEGKTLLSCQLNAGGRMELSIPVPSDGIADNCVLFYPALASESELKIWSLAYHCEPSKLIKKTVNLAGIICTYHREQYVLKNLEHFLKGISNTNLDGYLDFWVVDNGRTLSGEIFNDSRLHLIYQQNLGGSGGYSRGMEEVRNAGKYTHMILMDDDILTDIRCFERLHAFLSVVKTEYQDLCVGGSMLYMDEPYRQFEAGGIMDGLTQIGNGHFVDLREKQQVLENEKLRRVDYNGWWLMCIPVKAVGDNLPRPFFLKYDDVEFCLRCKLKIITLNGFCVWHELFEKKYSTVIEYYNTRNFWLMHTLLGTKYAKRDFVQKMKQDVLQKLYHHQYNAAQMILRGYEDAIKGMDYLQKIDPESLHQELLRCSERFLTERELYEQYQVAFRPERFRSGRSEEHWSIKQKLTLNGYLAPKFLYPKEEDGYRITDAIYDSDQMYFGADKVLHYNFFNQKGYVSEISKKTFWNGLCRLVKLAAQCLLIKSKKLSG